MIEVNSITLENDVEYIIISKETINNINYYYLANINDSNDLCIRKQINDELVGLDDEQEFNSIIKYFINKEFKNE